MSLGITLCKNLKEVIIPSGVTAISLSIFSYYDVDRLEISNDIETVNGTLGTSCRIKYIKFPNNLSSSANFSANTMSGCQELVSVILPENITTIPNAMFNTCYNLQTVTIPSTVTSLGSNSFYHCFSLQALTIPSGVTSIGGNAFYNCYSMKEYHFLSVLPPTLGSNVFYGIQPNTKIYVPEQSVDVYKGASNWSTYANYIYGE